VRANVTVPPFTQSQSMPSSAATVPTSSTAARIASAAGAPWRRVSDEVPAGNSAEHQPPVRPLAPNPAISCSTTTTRTPGSSRGSEYTVHSPV